MSRGMKGQSGGAKGAVAVKKVLQPHEGYTHGGHPVGPAANSAAAKSALSKAGSKGGALGRTRG
mgnify:CR=1 FL=1